MSRTDRYKTGGATFTQQAGDGHFAIEGVLDFESILTIMPLIKMQIATLAEISIDLAGVTYSNSAGIAMLLECMRQSNKQQKILHLKNFSEDMKSIIIMCGLEEIFTVL